MRNELEKLSNFLAAWRASHKAPTPLPQEVWVRAGAIAAQLGISATAKALRLDCAVLKRKMVQAAAPPRFEFVEILPTVQAQPVTLDCVLELQSNNGARLRVEARNLPVVELSAMVRDFRG